jgi:hypothetical protein
MIMMVMVMMLTSERDPSSLQPASPAGRICRRIMVRMLMLMLMLMAVCRVATYSFRQASAPHNWSIGRLVD